MRTALSVISTLPVFITAWALAAVLVWIALPPPSDFIFGEVLGYFFKVLIIMVIGPGVGAYYGVFYSKNWFPDVDVETIYVGFLSIVITLQIFALIFGIMMLLSGKPFGRGWFDIIAGIAQIASVTYGAVLAKRELA